MSSRVNFVRQQGFTDANAPACATAYPGLMFQPRVVGLFVVGAVLLQSAAYFLVLGAVLAWNVVAPRLNPFDAAYNRFVAGPRQHPPLAPAPGPRRFAQTIAAIFMLTIALCLWSGWTIAAWSVQAVLVLALAALVFGRFCLGSYLFLLLTGHADVANRTLPWARAE